ncbi:hypothetical protein D3C87_1958860 [compost metagenome]
MRPQGHIVQCVIGVAKDDDVDQRDCIDIGVLQHGVCGVQLRIIANLVARRVEHLKVVVGFELGADIQRNCLDIAGCRGVAR